MSWTIEAKKRHEKASWFKVPLTPHDIEFIRRSPGDSLGRTASILAQYRRACPGLEFRLNWR